MDIEEQDFTKSLLRILDYVLLTEEMALSKGYFAALSVAELHTLDAIGPYGDRSMSETATILGVTTGTLSVAVDRLVKKEYVQRRRDENDRRVVRICLTRSGKLAYRMHGKFYTLLVKRLMEPLDMQQQMLLKNMIRDIDSFMIDQYSKYKQQEIEQVNKKED